MKKFVVKELNSFLEIADQIETPLKFYFINEKLEAIVHMRTFLLAWEGEKGKERIKMLEDHGFVEAREEETKRITLEDLV